MITLVNKKFVALMQTLVFTSFGGADFKSDLSFFSVSYTFFVIHDF